MVLVFMDTKPYKLNIFNKTQNYLEFPLSHKKSLRVMRCLYLGCFSCQETYMSGYIFLWSLLAQVGLILLKKRWILTENLVRVHFKILGTSLILSNYSQLVPIPIRTHSDWRAQNDEPCHKQLGFFFLVIYLVEKYIIQ